LVRGVSSDVVYSDLEHFGAGLTLQYRLSADGLCCKLIIDSAALLFAAQIYLKVGIFHGVDRRAD